MHCGANKSDDFEKISTSIGFLIILILLISFCSSESSNKNTNLDKSIQSNTEISNPTLPDGTILIERVRKALKICNTANMNEDICSPDFSLPMDDLDFSSIEDSNIDKARANIDAFTKTIKLNSPNANTNNKKNAIFLYTQCIGYLNSMKSDNITCLPYASEWCKEIGVLEYDGKKCKKALLKKFPKRNIIDTE